MSAPPSRPFSTKRALVHTVVAVVAVVAVGGAVFGLLGASGPDSRRAGQAIGRLAGLIAAATFATSWLLQTGRRKAAVAIAVGYLALVGAAIAAGVLSREPHRDLSLTAAEKAPLVISDEGGERRLRHPGFGFSILHPGPKFVEAPELAQPKPGQKHDATTQEYGFADRDSGSVLLVSVMKGMGATREALSDHVDGFQRGFAESAPAGQALRWSDKQITWSEGRQHARLSASLSGGVRVELAAYAVTRAGQPPFIVNLMFVAPDAGRYAAVLASFRS